MRSTTPILLALSLSLAACGKDDDSGSTDGTSADGADGTGTDGTDGTDGTNAELPAGYAFESRDGSGSDSVSNSGQQMRHVLISDLKTYLSGLTDDLNTGSFPAPGDTVDNLNFYFEFDSSTGGSVEHGVATDPPTAQVTYDDISSGKNLVGKLAGNDDATDHQDWDGGAFVGWDSASSPEDAIRQWFAAIDQQAVDWSNGTYPTDPDGSPVTKVFLTSDGVDYQQLIDKLLRVGIGYSQTADDYMDDDVEGKGLLADHSSLAEGKNYTALEHAWDEGYGYFGGSRNYGEWTLDERKAAHKDDNGDGEIDLLTEKVWHCAGNAAKRDLGSSTGTTLGDDAYAAFFAGRELLANTDGDLSADQLTELTGYRDDAIAAMDKILAATVIHYINVTVNDQDAIGTLDYSFASHAKHWSEAKGFAFGFQFNPHTAMDPASFRALHDALGERPLHAGDSPGDRAAYRDALLSARGALGARYGFDTADLEAW